MYIRYSQFENILSCAVLKCAFFQIWIVLTRNFWTENHQFFEKKAHLSSGSYLNNQKFKAYSSIRQGLFKTNFKIFFAIFQSYFKLLWRLKIIISKKNVHFLDFFLRGTTFFKFSWFFLQNSFFYEFQIELKQWVFLQSIWFFVLVKADISYFTMLKFVIQPHHISSSYLGFKCAFFQKNLIFPKKWKKGAFKLSFGRIAKWTSYSKRATHFWSRTILVCLCDSWNKQYKQMIK